MKMKKNVIIMGAAGRDFHNFNMLYRDNPAQRVVAFTATQIPFIERRVFPKELSGRLYPEGIPVYPEEMLPGLIKDLDVAEVVFSYSDVTYGYIMERAAIATSLNASFVLLGAGSTMLGSKRPVISVCAVRTGCGKSGVTRLIGEALKEAGHPVVAIRHPMPYRDLRKERVERFGSLSDMTVAGCTIEEQEEFEPLIESGITVYAGVDYAEILKEAEKEARIIIWDGGNNDTPFIRPDLEIVVADPLRQGHELSYYPGTVNLKRARSVVINKVNSAQKADIERLKENIRNANPDATIIETASEVTVDGDIRGKNAVVVEDGPTLTHGGMGYGAGTIAAKANDAMPVDSRPYAVGTIKETLERYPHITNLLPAMGYSKAQIEDLRDTINRTPADIVLIATPADLRRVMAINKPCVRVRYEVKDITGRLKQMVSGFAEKALR
jgi:predicted GTPase